MTTRQIHSFVWSTIALVAAVVWGIYSMLNGGQMTNLFIGIGVGIGLFTFISCLILDNNFVGDVALEIFSWGFVKLPGLIFTLDLDGIIWLLTVKLIFWVLGFVLAIFTGILAIVLGSIISIFVYPFALYNSLNNKGDISL